MTKQNRAVGKKRRNTNGGKCSASYLPIKLDDANDEKPDCELDDSESVGMSVDEEDKEERVCENEVFVFDLRRAQICLAKYSCHLGRPLGTCVRFENVLKSFNPQFSLSTPDQFVIDLKKVFKEEKSRVKNILASLDSQISLSVDLLQYGFMCLVAHFIDDKWKLKKWVLKFGMGICIVKATKEMGIEGKIFSLLTSVGARYLDDEILQTVKSRVQKKKKLQLNGQLFSVDCCAQMFNLMAKDLYKELSVFKSLQELIEWEFTPLWNMVAWQLEHASYLASTGHFSSHDIIKDLPTVDVWEKARCVSKLLLRAYDVAKKLFETKYPTANIFLQQLQELRSALYEESLSADDFNSKMAKKMLERLDKYWNEVSFTLAIACVLDPRCKMRYIEYISSKGEISGNKLQPEVILDAIHSLYGEYVIRDGERQHLMTDSTQKSEEDKDSEEEDELPINAVVGEELCDSVLLQGYNQFIGSINQPPKSDLDRYLEDPVVPWSNDFNALSWWRVEGPKYPILSMMARDMLAVPMTVATSYDAYYAIREVDREIFKARRVSAMNILMCTRSWDTDDDK